MTVDHPTNCKCGAKMRPVIAGDAATFATTRACGRCKARWSVVVQPALLKLGDGTRAHQITMTCVRPGKVLTALRS